MLELDEDPFSDVKLEIVEREANRPNEDGAGAVQSFMAGTIQGQLILSLKRHENELPRLQQRMKSEYIPTRLRQSIKFDKVLAA